jgi:predicted metal-dependent hydrolase
MAWRRAIRGSSPAGAAQHIEVEHAGNTYRVLLRAAPTARRITLRVSHSAGNAVLTAPPRAAMTDVLAFAQRHAAWIGARLRRLPEPVPFAPGEIIPIRGYPHLVQHRPDKRGTVWIEQHHALESAISDYTLCVAGDAPHISRRITDYLKRAAKSDLEAAVEHYCRKLETPSRCVTVRDTTSRWGSCSATGSLNFSWRLILAPAFVLDYLAAHEVAHLVHMNHSKRFWTLLRRLCPETDRAEAWLNVNGPQLYRYGKARPEA